MSKSYDEIIFDYINQEMAKQYPDVKVFFAYTRIDEPAKPYLLISEANTDEIHKTVEENGNVKEYRRSFMTIGVYFDSKTVENMSKAKQAIAYIRRVLSSNDCFNYLQDYNISNRYELISATRNLTESVSGGITYRYEFDISFDYHEILERGFEIGRGIDLEIDNETSKIDFEIYLD